LPNTERALTLGDSDLLDRELLFLGFNPVSGKLAVGDRASSRLFAHGFPADFVLAGFADTAL
jgi:hypothetical protein